ncbi:MAG: Putative DNA-binding protein [uncultured Paraburkholderia sp.]|nr:MAG: Putative DNA-binding protein [uncultured Paraburkholderia sp.]CAH2936355.1 MAG: Putative DNA-binding protein [uncultured Paraburkholderia sp.]CAH2937928.1 MAG: Putative DNA-binding protein [uncultured Paraburkholderia sp.]
MTTRTSPPVSADHPPPLDATPACAHRERLLPQAVGLPPGPRRRTPGLRREEVAQLCGVSPTWYTWIEQGRPVSASADAPATLLQTVQLVNAPACVRDRQWNALAWNERAAALFVGWLDGAHDRNLLRYTFTEPAARELIVDWETRARRLAAEFRADSIRHLNDAPTRALIDSLSAASDAFARFWASQDVGGREGGRREFNHPREGRLVYDQITFKPAHREDLKLVVLVRE